MLDAWKQATLGELASVTLSGVDKHIVPGETMIHLCNYLDVYRNRRLTKEMSFAEGSAKAGEITRLSLQKGDVIITKDSETPDDIGIPSLVLDDLSQVVCGYHLALIRPRASINSTFLLHYLQSEAAKRYFLRMANGLTRFGLGARAISDLPVSFPELDRQETIATILDAVDTGLERTRVAMETVHRLRRALMQHLLPPWLGFRDLGTDHKPEGIVEIPRIDEVATVCNGSTPSRLEQRYWRHGSIPWLATGKVNDRIIRTADEFVTDAALRECSISIIPTGSVLVAMIGQGRTRGMSAYLEVPACINQNFGALTPRTIPNLRIIGKWLFYYMDFHYSRVRELGGGTNQGALNCYLLKRVRIPIPSLEQQEKVAVILDAVDCLEFAYVNAQGCWRDLKNGLMQRFFATCASMPDEARAVAS